MIIYVIEINTVYSFRNINKNYSKIKKIINKIDHLINETIELLKNLFILNV